MEAHSQIATQQADGAPDEIGRAGEPQGRGARFEIAYDGPEGLVLRDVGPWDQHPTITNDAEGVVARMANWIGPRRLFYIDSWGDLDELVIRAGGHFATFKPGAPADVKLALEQSPSGRRQQAPVGETSSSHLRNALQILVAIRVINSGPLYLLTPDEVERLEFRIKAALEGIERDAGERKNVLAMMDRS